MERYIKPSCEIVEIAENCNLLDNSTEQTYNEVTSGKAFAPRRGSFEDSDAFEEDGN